MEAARSLRLLFATIGSRGDVQPMIALAQAARARGHRPLVAAPVNFESWVRECGLDFAAFGVDMQRYMRENSHSLGGGARTVAAEVRRAMREHMPAEVRELKAAIQGADAILWSGLAFVAPSVAQWAKVPVLGVVYSTVAFRSASHPPPIVRWMTAPRWINRLLWRIHMHFAEDALGVPLRIEREALGLSRTSIAEHFVQAQRYVVVSDETIFPASPDWDVHADRANFIFWDDPRALEPGLESWLAEGEPPIFAGFGSMDGPGPRRAVQAFIDAFAGSGRRCLIGAGWAGLGAQGLPPGWRVVGDVPHAKLFPRVAAVVHHGGAGTMAAALRAGVPQVVLPMLLDQFHNGHRLWLAGLAPRYVPMDRITGAKLGKLIDEALALPPQPRLAAAQRLRASDAASTVLDIAESLCAAPQG